MKVVPYGSGYVKVLEGLEGGEVLKQLTTPKRSGQNRGRGKDSGDGGFGAPPAGGAGGFPGGGFPGGGPM